MAKTTFTLNRVDLDFLYEQIVSIGTDYTQLSSALDPRGVRETAGTNNNLVGHGDLDDDPATTGPGPNGDWGAADQPFLRISDPVDRTGVDADGNTSSYTPYGSNVQDASPRLISNLVANSWTDPANPTSNPAAVAAQETWGGETVLDPFGNEAAFIPNVGPLGAASYNNQFVFFGQFFDHGLDFIQKDGSSGFVEIQLLPSDPHYVEGGRNVMMINRANLANADAVVNDGAEPIYLNNTGLLIDQSQTYGSHPTVNAILREYEADGSPTGRMVTGDTIDPAATGPFDIGNPPPLHAAGTSLATWADIKANALRIGIVLEDSDALNMRELATDAAGGIVRDISGNATFTGELTNQPLLIDISPNANPDFHFDIDPTTGLERVYAGGLDYDADLLSRHYVVGDGRANENSFLTAQHHVWHDEHNFQVQNLTDSILADAAASGSTEFLDNWLVPGADPNVAPELLQWDGEKLFQAARAITETEYNHVAIDEYVGRLVADLPEFVSYTTDINMAVSLDFAQSIFRLGHSMLTENLEIRGPDGSVIETVPLFDAFLNPDGFAANQNAQGAPAGLLEGAIKQLANEVDEFITPALQQTLVGQPLDLAAINIARGRDIGLPTWNEFRQQVFDGLTQNTSNSANAGALAPYQSWTDVGAHLRNPETLVNLIAAYGDPDDSSGYGLKAAREAGDLDGARAAAAEAMLNDTFMNGTPTFDPVSGTWSVTGGDEGFWDIDLWIGGLAERPLIDGMLGTTFSFVFLDFAQRMQDGDRFYYLFRMPPGSSIGEQIISTKFSDIIARNGLTNDLNGDAFAYADRYYNPDPAMADGGQSHFTDDGNGNFYFSAYTALLDDADPASLAAGGHVVISGGDGNDHLISGDGDDTVHGGAGNDYIQGSQGNDHLFGGAGDDFIIDDENDDFIRGGDGDDTVFAGKGALDTVFGELGNDELHGGDGIDELFGGEGDDAIFGDGDTDVMIGGGGNDFMHGGDSVDEMWGGDDNDIMMGGVGDDHLNGDGGNDLLFGGLGAAANDGDRFVGDLFPTFAGAFPTQEGFGSQTGDFVDIVSYEDVGIAITADLETSNENGTGSNLIDTYAFIEGLVGSQFDDNLTGASETTTTTNGADNILVGGAGNDVLTGLGGDDYIAGDWVVVTNDLAVAASQDKSTAIVDSHGLNRINTGDAVPPGGNPEAHLGHVLGDNGAEGASDTAVFSGGRSDYEISVNPDGTLQIVDLRGIDSTAVGDTLKDIEFIIFQADGPTPVPTTEFTDPGTGTAGTPGDDNLVGTPNADTIDGLGGNDTIRGRGGADTLIGGDGNDSLYGNGGADTLNGNRNSDNLFGGGGADTLNGGRGRDTLDGGRGNDTVNGNGGRDTINWSVGDGRDIVDGGGGVDTVNITGDSTEERFDIYTNAFAVEELGYVGAAGIVIARNGEIIAELSRIEEIFVDGMGGGDEFDIRGDFGDTSLSTNTIIINGTEGDDTVDISGLESEHRVVFHSNGGSDTIVGELRPQDVIETEANQVVVDKADGTTLIAAPAAPSDGATNTDPGSDPNADPGNGDQAGNGGASENPAAAPMMLIGSDTDDNLIGGAGNDTAAANDGNDNVIGQDGDDLLLGGAGDDVILAGAGNDFVLGGQGMDYILAGEGDDWVQSGADRDVVDAGSGNDTIVATFGDGEDVYRGGDGEDTYDLAAITSDATIDLGLGIVTSEQSGQDSITRIENVIAGAGDDTIIAGNAANVLSGGIGDDTFVFNSVEAAHGDTITDFAPGDAIDLSGIAAQFDLAQSFTLLSEGATFSQAGQLVVRAADDGVYVDGNVDGDAQAEFTIKVNGATNLDQDDFV